MPKVSVIVPVYNVSAYIERCVRSLFEQTLKDLDYIFVDDCTPDDSISILQGLISQYPEREPFVRIVAHKENLGLPAARKSGLDAATGEYVIYCDSDDWVDRDMYRKLLDKAVEDNADMVFSGYCESDGEKTTKVCHVSPEPDILRSLIADLIPGFTCTKLIRKSLFTDEILFPEYNLFEDTLLSIQLAGNSKRISIVDEPLYYYYQNISGLSFSPPSEKKYLEARENLSATISYLKEKGFAKKYPAETRVLKCRITRQLVALPNPLFRKYHKHIAWHFLFSRYCTFEEKAGYITKVLGIHGISRYFSLKQWKNLKKKQ